MFLYSFIRISFCTILLIHAVLWQIARAAAIREGVDPSTRHSHLLQELRVAVRSHRARAVLRRRVALGADADNAAICS